MVGLKIVNSLEDLAEIVVAVVVEERGTSRFVHFRWKQRSQLGVADSVASVEQLSWLQRADDCRSVS